MRNTIFWAGDSTVKQNDITSYPQTGIGQGFELYITRDWYLDNRAENGRSTKSFISEGRLDYIDENIKEGDFLFVQFGHNDEKPDEERHTEPFGSFLDNLEKFRQTALSHKAHMVLITPLYRRLFTENGTLVEGTHMTYPDAMKEFGAKHEIPVIDLCEISRHYIEKLGEEASRHLFMHLEAGAYPNYMEGKADNTHLQYHGAVSFAGIIANELRKLGGIYSSFLLPLDAEKEDPNLLVD
ncbi:MAG: rhamnogalacturonan acetylesterase [Lachnospiraceae bacterium]|nr:rhamnogalacturonan acetylesterase [Lachnospiraceae bacterium]